MSQTHSKPAPQFMPDGLCSDAWLTPGRFAFNLAGLIFLCFPLVVCGFQTFFFRDFGAFGYPLAFYHRECFWRGEMPLWNPYNFCGIPFLAQWNTLTLYPGSLFYLIFPLSWSLGMFCLGHLFLGGMGMYFLAQRWTGNRLAAAIAGTVFAFNGLSWDALMWPNNIAALGWMPWVVLASERAWREGGRRVLLAGLAGGLQMLTGAPEIIALTWLCAGTFWLVELATGEIPRARSTARFFCALALTAGLAAAQLLPFFDLLSHSQRGAGFSDLSWSLPLTGWLNFLVPPFHMASEGEWFVPYGQYWTTSYYLGAGTVALALLALWRARDRRTWTLAALAAFGLVMALGERGGLYAWLKSALPMLGFMRYPVKFVVLAVFTLPLLAAKGAAWFRSVPAEKWVVERKKFLSMGMAVLAMIALIVVWEWVAPKPKDDRVKVLENAVVRADFLAGGLVCLRVLRRIAEVKLRLLLTVCLLMLFWFDVYTHGPNLSPTVERAVFEPDTVRDFFKWDTELRPGESRARETRASIDRVMYHSVSEAALDVNGRRLALFANYNLLDHAAKIDGEYSLDMREMDKLYHEIHWSDDDLPKLMDFLGVALTSGTNAVNWIARPSFLPMITAGQAPFFLYDAAALRAVMGGQFAPSETVILEPAAEREITARRAEVKISSRRFAASEVGAEAEASAPALVVVAQAFYHNWHAYIDGQPAHLWRANYAFQALEIPAGKHFVKLRYEDKRFNLGVGISLGTLAIATVVWVGLGRRRIAVVKASRRAW